MQLWSRIELKRTLDTLGLRAMDRTLLTMLSGRSCPDLHVHVDARIAGTHGQR